MVDGWCVVDGGATTRWWVVGLFNCVCERAIKRGKSGKRGRSPRKPPHKAKATKREKEIADK
jgi:hypothetical protein